ncbi:MAG: OmpA family protein [Bacteroidales bacterium]
MKTIIKSLVVIALLCIPCTGNSQINLKKKIETQTNNRANQRASQGVNKGLDAVEGGIKGAFKKKENTEQPEQQAQEDKADQPAAGNEAKAANEADKPGKQVTPSLESFSKYDFIPGQKVIFFEDFSQDAIGDFPALWNTNGSAEVVTTNLFPGKWMKYDSREAIWTDGLLDLPENYTIEFDVVPVKDENGAMKGYIFWLMQSETALAGQNSPLAGIKFVRQYYGRPDYSTFNMDNNLNGMNEDAKALQKAEQKYHMAIWVQKTRIRLYQNETKVFDLPKAFSKAGLKMNRLRFEDGAAMVSNIRVAVGAPDTRNKLITEGKLVTYGIYFDVNKDVVKPESYGTLKDISAVLQENPDVRVKIVGHTDSDGADAANLDLSKRRGESVKNELVKTFGIDASRLESDGMGEGQPVSPNDSPVNKALNRRVEFIKL